MFINYNCTHYINIRKDLFNNTNHNYKEKQLFTVNILKP